MTTWGDVPKYPRCDELVAAPLTRGDQVAWVRKSRGGRCTIGLSLVHRVFEGRETYCLATIPDADRLIAPLKSLKPCRVCDENYVNGATFEEIIRRSQSSQQGAA